MKLNFTICVFLLSLWGFSQNEGKQESYSQIPNEYQSHPELGKTTHSATITNEIAYELIQERTKFSRTFLNTNTTRTTVHSSVPLHYPGTDGKWYSIDYKLTRNNNKLVYPAQHPFFELGSGHTTLVIDNQKINISEKSNFIFLADDGAVLKTIRSGSRQPSQKATARSY